MLKFKIAWLSIPKTVKIYLIMLTVTAFILFLGFIYLLNELSVLRAFKKVNKHKQLTTVIDFPDKWDLVTCTIYNPCPAQGWGNGDTLFDGTKIKKEFASGYRYVSMSEDLLKRYHPDDYIYVYAFENETYFTGVWKVKDKMHSRKRNQIDFLQAKTSKINLNKNICFIKKIKIKENL